MRSERPDARSRRRSCSPRWPASPASASTRAMPRPSRGRRTNRPSSSSSTRPSSWPGSSTPSPWASIRSRSSSTTPSATASRCCRWTSTPAASARRPSGSVCPARRCRRGRHRAAPGGRALAVVRRARRGGVGALRGARAPEATASGWACTSSRASGRRKARRSMPSGRAAGRSARWPTSWPARSCPRRSSSGSSAAGALDSLGQPRRGSALAAARGRRGGARAARTGAWRVTPGAGSAARPAAAAHPGAGPAAADGAGASRGRLRDPLARRAPPGHGAVPPALDALGALHTRGPRPSGGRGGSRIGGLVVTRQHPMTAKGTVFLALEDETGMVNVTLWPRTGAELRGVVRRHALLYVEGDAPAGGAGRQPRGAADPCRSPRSAAATAARSGPRACGTWATPACAGQG